MTNKEIEQERQKAKELIGLVDNGDYYKGIIAALEWAQGRRSSLITQKELDRAQKNIKLCMRNGL